jgi:hypothetical protein
VVSRLRSLPGAAVTTIDLTKKGISYTPQKSLLGALKKRGFDLDPIYCGGRSAVDQQREQWTDGANAFTLAPGIILLYERNVRTAEELAAHGYNIVYEDDLLLGRTELETWTDKKYAIQMAGHELSRTWRPALNAQNLRGAVMPDRNVHRAVGAPRTAARRKNRLPAPNAARWLAEIVRHDYKLIVHGNDHRLATSWCRRKRRRRRSRRSLDVCVAQTEGRWVLPAGDSQPARQHRHRRRRCRSDGSGGRLADPVQAPTKPIGPFFTSHRAEALERDRWTMREDAGRGWRHVVLHRALRILNVETMAHRKRRCGDRRGRWRHPCRPRPR